MAEAITDFPIPMTGVQARLTKEEEQALLRVLREADTLSIGAGGAPQNNTLEKDFRDYIGCADAV